MADRKERREGAGRLIISVERGEKEKRRIV
jgi:hypothetical protein